MPLVNADGVVKGYLLAACTRYAKAVPTLKVEDQRQRGVILAKQYSVKGATTDRTETLLAKAAQMHFTHFLGVSVRSLSYLFYRHAFIVPTLHVQLAHSCAIFSSVYSFIFIVKYFFTNFFFQVELPRPAGKINLNLSQPDAKGLIISVTGANLSNLLSPNDPSQAQAKQWFLSEAHPDSLTANFATLSVNIAGAMSDSPKKPSF